MKSLFVNFREAIPFFTAAIGVILDASTTLTGLSMGLHETHPDYNPVIALMIFWSLIAVVRILPRTRIVRFFIILLSAAPFLGAVNNSLVIMDFYSGLPI